jgi:predicted N-acetyltransferase YhbS
MKADLIIRNAQTEDRAEIEQMTREAFWNLYVPGCDEHYLVHIIRDHPDYIPEMEFVAVLDGRIVGSIIYTRSFLLTDSGEKSGGDGERIETLSFGPLCVRPGYQRQGIGSALMAHTAARARASGCLGIFIYGHPHNYCKAGFRNGKDLGVSDPTGRFPLGLLGLPLDASLFNKEKKYRFFQSPVFELDPDKAVAFDRTLPEWKKEYRYTQELFSMACRAYLD